MLQNPNVTTPNVNSTAVKSPPLKIEPAPKNSTAIKSLPVQIGAGEENPMINPKISVAVNRNMTGRMTRNIELEIVGFVQKLTGEPEYDRSGFEFHCNDSQFNDYAKFEFNNIITSQSNIDEFSESEFNDTEFEYDLSHYCNDNLYESNNRFQWAEQNFGHKYNKDLLPR